MTFKSGDSSKSRNLSPAKYYYSKFTKLKFPKNRWLNKLSCSCCKFILAATIIKRPPHPSNKRLFWVFRWSNYIFLYKFLSLLHLFCFESTVSLNFNNFTSGDSKMLEENTFLTTFNKFNRFMSWETLMLLLIYYLYQFYVKRTLHRLDT